ncbi:hypothetical protein SAMN06297251_10121 [Fulvimarina manganoxydans]|uniref:Uncharacterized protein n=1 Tax=Fulvimarina manganoxydans TaxID=937218 RepID=A0A1W1Y877_9HYPH|nr:hypothetical protein [Fulvimarina manganoxydans]SMC32356.1 hypothetical protein SAMN06297251_10121 [Fulvimarina manganoxydans]
MSGDPNNQPPPAPRAFAWGTVAAVLTAIAALVASTGGFVSNISDAWDTGSQSSAQIDTIDQRLKIVEEIVPQIEAVRATAERLSDDMKTRIVEAQRAGQDVSELRQSQRELERQLIHLRVLVDAMRGEG